jgi:hypothetical protein
MARLRLVFTALLTLFTLLGGFLPAATAQAASVAPAPGDTRYPDERRLGTLPFNASGLQSAPADELTALATYTVGATRLFPALNDALGFYEFRTFTLRAVGKSAEVWVAADLQFPIGDCRGLVEITQDQVNYMLGQFDERIYPGDTSYFGTPKSRDGSKAALPELYHLPADYYAGSDRNIILIDNVRDDNYYNFERYPTYIAGFFSPAYATVVNRNVITIDAYDWQHRTGAHPPDEPTDNPCTNRTARPFLYEGTFAHEYQHLIHNDYDPGEETWINEGMSDFAEAINGYSFPDRPIWQTGNDGHIQSFYGFATQLVTANGQPVRVATSGAENSLTSWGDQGADEILADYGLAYAFMLYANEHFGGAQFMRAWQNNPKHGIASFEDTLAKFGYQTTFNQVYHDFAVAMVVDQLLDEGAKGPNDNERYSVQALHAMVSLNTDQAYGIPGAPPYGSDYVKITDPAGISALNFSGAPDLVRPLKWRSRTSGPAGWAGGDVLSSGAGNDYDSWLVSQVTLGDGPQTLSFDTYYDIEHCYDYGFVEVSTDGGKTFTSLGNNDTTDCTSNDPSDPTDPRIAAQTPGFSGQTDGWISTSFDLSAYANQTILLAFHYATDPAKSGNDSAASNDGWWLDNIAVNGAVLSDGSTASLASFGDITTFQPIPTAYTVQVIGIKPGQFTVTPLAVDPATKLGTLSAAQLTDLAGYEYIVAVVTFDAPLDALGQAITDYGSYALTVTRNGVATLLPGGGMDK